MCENRDDQKDLSTKKNQVVLRHSAEGMSRCANLEANGIGNIFMMCRSMVIIQLATVTVSQMLRIEWICCFQDNKILFFLNEGQFLQCFLATRIDHSEHLTAFFSSTCTGCTLHKLASRSINRQKIIRNLDDSR